MNPETALGFFDIALAIAAIYFLTWMYGEMRTRYGGQFMNPIFVGILVAAILMLAWMFR